MPCEKRVGRYKILMRISTIQRSTSGERRPTEHRISRRVRFLGRVHCNANLGIFRPLVFLAVAAVGSGCQNPGRSAPMSAGRETTVAEPAPRGSEPSAESTAEAIPQTGDLPREDENERWLWVEAIREGADGGWATGEFDPARNRIRISTEKIRGFAIDVSRIAIDWERLVVLRINGMTSELRKREDSVLHFVKGDGGRWEVVEP